MQPKTHRLISVLLLAVLLLTLAAPALAQEPAPAPLAAAPQAAGATCSPLSKEDQATFDKLAQLKEAGQLDSAGYDLFLKLGEQAACAATAAAPTGPEAAADYSFASSIDTYTALSGATTSTATGDDGSQTGVPIGFTFTYDSVAYTSVSINVNGFIRLASSVFASPWTNDLASTTKTLALAPLWDDLYDDTSSFIYYKTEGPAPNRVFTVEWNNVRWAFSSGTQQNFQVKLFETTNQVKFVYGTMAAPVSGTASIGINDATGGSGHFISVTPAAGTGDTFSTTTANNSISAATNLTSGKTYSFTPPVVVTPPACATSFSPAHLATGVAATANLSWASGGGSPTGYKIYFGTDNPPTNIANGTDLGLVTTYDPPGNMAYSTPYYWKIVPYNANGPATGCPVWSFTTEADPTVTVFPYSQDFNGVTAPALPSGWSRENTNADAYAWESNATYKRGTSGNGVVVHWNSSAAMNDWLFTPPLQLAGGVTYGVRFFYRAAGATFPEKMEVKWGSANSSAAMTNGPIFDDSNITHTVMKEAIATFTPGSNGVYYVGFHGYSAADMFYLIVDDVTVYDTADSTWQWQGGAGNDWFVNANWEGSIVPGELDEVKIPVVVRAPNASSPVIGSSSETSYGKVNNLTVDAGATLELATNHNLKVQGTLTNNGTLKQTRAVSLGSPTVFLNITDSATTPVSKYFGVEMNPTSVNMGNTTVTVSGNQKCAGVGNSTVKRCYTITPTTQAAADIKFYFSEPEMTPTGQPLASQNVWNYHTSVWNAVTRGTDSGTCASGAINCFVQGTGIATYSPFAVGPAQPLAVTLASFTAQGGADRITVAWETVSETGNAGFNLYRSSDPSGPLTLLAYVPSQSPGSTQGFAYRVEDLAVQPGETWWYTLEDVALNGATTLHGPVSATVQAPTAVTLGSLDASPAAAGSALPWLLLAAGAGLALGARRMRR